MKKYIVSALMSFMFLANINAQEEGISIVKDGKVKVSTVFDKTDSTRVLDTLTLSKKELRKQKVANRNLHYNILGGPSYTPDLGVLIGGTSLLTFRINPEDTLQLRSIIPPSIAIMLKGGVSVQIKPQLFFKNDKFRIFGQFSYKNILENFYGIGYNTNKNWERSDSTSQYRYNGIQINPWFLFRIKNSD